LSRRGAHHSPHINAIHMSATAHWKLDDAQMAVRVRRFRRISISMHSSVASQWKKNCRFPNRCTMQRHRATSGKSSASNLAGPWSWSVKGSGVSLLCCRLREKLSAGLSSGGLAFVKSVREEQGHRLLLKCVHKEEGGGDQRDAPEEALEESLNHPMLRCE